MSVRHPIRPSGVQHPRTTTLTAIRIRNQPIVPDRVSDSQTMRTELYVSGQIQASKEFSRVSAARTMKTGEQLLRQPKEIPAQGAPRPTILLRDKQQHHLPHREDALIHIRPLLHAEATITAAPRDQADNHQVRSPAEAEVQIQADDKKPCQIHTSNSNSLLFITINVP